MDTAERLSEVNFFRSKMCLIKVRLADVKSRQREHEKQWIRLGLYARYSKACIHTLNVSSATSAILSLIGTNASILICAIASTLSSVMTAVLSAWDLEKRQAAHHDTHIRLLDLYNNISAEILHDAVSSSGLDAIIDDLNHRSTLLFGHAPDTCLISTSCK